ncbi:unnamed protein product, partial [Ostreobium quekettii]
MSLRSPFGVPRCASSAGHRPWEPCGRGWAWRGVAGQARYGLSWHSGAFSRQGVSGLGHGPRSCMAAAPSLKHLEMEILVHQVVSNLVNLVFEIQACIKQTKTNEEAKEQLLERTSTLATVLKEIQLKRNYEFEGLREALLGVHKQLT